MTQTVPSIGATICVICAFELNRLQLIKIASEEARQDLRNQREPTPVGIKRFIHAIAQMKQFGFPDEVSPDQNFTVIFFPV